MMWTRTHAPRARRWTSVMIGMGALCLFACKDLTVRPSAGTVDPKHYATPEAALQMARSARYQFHAILLPYFAESGYLADELFDPDTAQYEVGVFVIPDGVSRWRMVLDHRYLPEQDPLIADILKPILQYNALQRVRSATATATHALAQYDPERSNAFQAELIAYEALVEIMLADNYCSGVPLSTVEYGGDFKYKPGSRTTELYTHALHLLDSALAIQHSNANIRALVQVVRGRVLLGLGRADDARLAVQSVPTGFKHELPVFGLYGTARNPSGFDWSGSVRNRSVADRKGRNGLPFRTANDPRIKLDTLARFPRYPGVRTTLVVADHIEARLIEAEAQLLDNDSKWLTTLNDLRTNGTLAGSGGIAGLAPLTDPAAGMSGESASARDARLDLLMYERAFWLFFTGHRQGDLRRLLRNYGRKIEDTYPTGRYKGGIGSYASYVDIPIPDDELLNPHFSGCLGRGE